MSFASPGWLLLLLLGGVIVFLHSRPRRNVEVSSLFLWRDSVSLPAPHAARTLPPPNRLMLLQLLVLTLVAIGLARPVFGARAERTDHWIVLLDASAGMQGMNGGETSFDRAREHVSRELRRGDSVAGRVSIIRVSNEPAVLAARIQGADQVRASLDRMQPSHARAEWSEVPGIVAGLEFAGESTRLSVLSDRAGVAEALAMLEEGPGRTVDALTFGEVGANQSLANVAAYPLNGAAGRWLISGEIHSFAGDGEFPSSRTEPLSILFAPEGSRDGLAWDRFDLQVGSETITPFQVEVELPGAGGLELRLSQDAVPHDDRAFVVLRGEPRAARVLHVGNGNSALEHALVAVPGVEITRAAALPAETSGFDLVVIDGRMAVERIQTSVLRVGALGAGEEAPRIADPAPIVLLPDHPLGRSVDWTELSLEAAHRIPLLPGADVILEASGHPLIQTRTTSAGREVLLAFDLADSDWADQLGFPAFVANVVHWAVPDAGAVVAGACQAGHPCPLRPEELAGGVRVTGPGVTDLRVPALIAGEPTSATEDGGGSRQQAGMSSDAWLARGLEGLFTPQQSGIYTIESASGRRQVAVNAPSVAPSSGAVVATASISLPEVTEAPATPLFPLWSWLLLLGVAALLVEAWIAGRGSERFLRREGLARDNPQAGRRRAILGLRAAAIILLIAAILDVRGIQPIREADAVLVVDDPGARVGSAGAGESLLTRADREATRGRRLGLVRLGGGGRVARDLGDADGEGASEGAPPAGTDLSSALKLASALIPSDRIGRVVLASDGRETRGAVASALPALLQRRIPIDVLPLSRESRDDISIERVSTARAVHAREVTQLVAVISSPREAVGTVRLFRDGLVAAERTADLLIGRTRLEFEIEEEQPGTVVFEVEVEVAGDRIATNNRDGIVVNVAASPRIAIVTPQGSWGRAMADALALHGLTAEVVPPAAISPAAGAAGRATRTWSDFDVVALMNVPADQLADGAAESLERWVRDSGGGLLLLGGENTFGPGGYHDTPLERISPLSAKVPQEMPNLAIAFVLDRSGSMAASAGAASRLDVARVATLEAVDLLDPESQVGVIAFDVNASIIVPMQPAGNKGPIRAQLEQLAPGGGTWIFPGLALAYVELSRVDPDFRRHIVVMTDGISRRADYRSLMAEIVEAGMTVSTAAIGEGADVILLAELAQLGGGAAHVTTDFSQLPSILAREATRFSSGAVREEQMAATWKSRDATFLQSFPDSPPRLQGFVRTTAKPGADVHLEGDEEIPLLASWRHGLGRVVSFASHGAGPWAADWMASPGYAAAWAQTFRWALPGAAGPGLHLSITRDRDVGRITVEAVRADGAPETGLDLRAEIGAPDGGRRGTASLREVEPGTYQGSFMADQPGSYSVVAAPMGDPSRSRAEAVEGRLFIGYPAGLASLSGDSDLLHALAVASGGRVLSGSETIFADGVPVQWTRRSIWPFWAALALVFFMMELLGRYTSVLARGGKRGR